MVSAIEQYIVRKIITDSKEQRGNLCQIIFLLAILNPSLTIIWTLNMTMTGPDLYNT